MTPEETQTIADELQRLLEQNSGMKDHVGMGDFAIVELVPAKKE